ncbi:MAG: 23S rRNA (guanosine(2251)-2'-O)-methyltransferase RlmB, partial [Acidimicrobiales bacterium]
ALPEADLDDLCRPRADGTPPFLLAVDGVTDPQNLGALLRTAEAAGVTGVVLPRHRAVHVTPAVAKAAAGAIEHVPMAVVGGLPAALITAQQAGVWIVGLVTDSDDDLFATNLGDGPVMAVLGAEGAGLSRLVRQRCDVLATIPMRGELGSLNVAAAGAVTLFELARQRGA